ncbi:hypothetical protein HY497_00830, partial [Candidatus Woesearchaeota archaeon]|nr:hypothetical protein [Candidatus Woesearchaeota archaeon]
EIEEESATKKREEKEKKIQQEIMRRIDSCQKKLAQREREIQTLEKKGKELHEQGKWLRLWWHGIVLRRKQQQLEDLKRITPSPRSAELRRMLGGR